MVSYAEVRGVCKCGKRMGDFEVDGEERKPLGCGFILRDRFSPLIIETFSVSTLLSPRNALSLVCRKW